METRSPWPAFFVAASGAFMGTLDGSIVNLALPSFANPAVMPGGSFTAASWVVIAFFLAGTATLLTSGRIGDQLGRRRTYVAGLAIFTTASALCGLAPNVNVLIASRVVQALGASLLAANGASILVEAFPPAQRGKALGLFGTVIAAGLSAGAPLGGLLMSDPRRWPLIFLINVPVGLVAIPFALRALPKDPPRAKFSFDWVGSLLLAVSLASLGLLTESLHDGELTLQGVTLFVAFAGALAAFPFVERRVASPIVDLALFREWTFTGGSLAVLFAFSALQSVMLTVPYFLVDLSRLPMPMVGLLMLSSPLTLSITAPISGRLSDRTGTRAPAAIGMAVTALAYVLLALMTPETRPLSLAARTLLLGFGMGLFVAPNNSAVMGSVPSSRLGTAGGLIATMRNLGASVGGALTSILFATTFLRLAGERYDAEAGRAHAEAMLSAMRVVFFVAAALAATAAVLSLSRRSTRATS